MSIQEEEKYNIIVIIGIFNPLTLVVLYLETQVLPIDLYLIIRVVMEVLVVHGEHQYSMIQLILTIM